MVCTLDKNIEHFPLGSSACVRMYVRGLEWMAWTLFFGKRYAIPCTEIYVKYCEVCRNTAKDGERRRDGERKRKHGKDGENTGRTAKTRDRRRKHGRAGGRGDGENKGFMKLSSENLFSLILLGASHTKETCLGSPGMTCGCGALSAAPAINVEVSPDSLRAELCRSVSVFTAPDGSKALHPLQTSLLSSQSLQTKYRFLPWHVSDLHKTLLLVRLLQIHCW